MGRIMNLEKINPIKKDLVEKILHLVDGYEYLDKMIIFGSSIRDDCREDSDIDIAVKFTKKCYDRSGVLKPFTLPVCEAISMTTKGNNDVVYVGYEGELIKDAVRNGVVVYERDNV